MVATEVKRERKHDRVSALLTEMRLTDVRADNPELLVLYLAYRQKFNLGDYFDEKAHVSKRWRAMYFQGRMLSVFGERDKADGTLEVTDAYCEDSRFGQVAVCVMFLAYLGIVNRGEKKRLHFTVAFENIKMWNTVVREIKRPPIALVFEYEGAT